MRQEHEVSHKIYHFGVKKFIPVYQREDGSRNYIEKGVKIERYFYAPVKGIYNYWQVGKTSIPKKVWAIARVRRHRIGQLELFN